MNQKERKPEDKRGALLAIVIIGALSVITNMDDSREVFLPFITVTLTLLGIFIAAVQAKKKKAEGKPAASVKKSPAVKVRDSQHNHDRLSAPARPETGLEHWKKQLDDLYSAGIIDRTEYNVLWKKHSDTLK